MLQSWNKMCFSGGHLEASISLPGKGDVVGFWPGFWAMGNLGRPGYAATTDGMWPYTYDNICDAGITPNQSSTDGLNWLPGMRLPACTCSNEDHPTPGVSRSAPEIDVIEASVSQLDEIGNQIGVVSQSAQIAPFDVWWYPDYGKCKISTFGNKLIILLDYITIQDPTLTSMNSYTGGNYQQAASGLTALNNDWYDGKAYQKYAFEYYPGSEGSINWFVGDSPTWSLDARSVRQNGNVGQRVIPKEPMALIMNFGMSGGFAQLNLTGLAPTLPATMRFDYVRIYQDTSSMTTGCDPDGYPTTEYIKQHPEPYANLNITRW
jgi:beta-glucan synthesis-associated protein KRE6